MTVGEFHLPVSTNLSLNDLTLLASSCHAVGAQVCCFAYRGAVGKPLPEAPNKEQLRKIAKDSGLQRVLSRLDIDDLGEVATVGLSTTSATSAASTTSSNTFNKFFRNAIHRFDMFSLLLRNDPLLFERINIQHLFVSLGNSVSATSSSSSSSSQAAADSSFLEQQCDFPLIINLDGVSPSALVLPRKHVPPNSIAEISFSSFFFTSQQQQQHQNNNTNQQQLLISAQSVKQTRALISKLKHFPLLISCGAAGGNVIGVQDLESALFRIKSPIDSACLTEQVICASERDNILQANRNLCKIAFKSVVLVGENSKKKNNMKKNENQKQQQNQNQNQQPVQSKSKASAAPPPRVQLCKEQQQQKNENEETATAKQQQPTILNSSQLTQLLIQQRSQFQQQQQSNRNSQKRKKKQQNQNRQLSLEQKKKMSGQRRERSAEKKQSSTSTAAATAAESKNDIVAEEEDKNLKGEHDEHDTEHLGWTEEE